jgi:2-pyrone-4,6-dicarboxylate lactonase
MMAQASAHPPYHPQPSAPRRKVPAGAWDTHFHIFESAERGAADPTAAYAPIDAPRSALARMHARLGIEYGVLVQTTAVLANYDLYIDQLNADPRLKGVAVIDDNTTEAQLEALHRAGVRGARFHFAAFIKKRPTMETFQRTVARIAELGWHVVLHTEPSDLIELAPVFAKLPIPFVIDHLCHTRISEGVEQPGFQQLLKLHQLERCWVKVSNGDRWSDVGPPDYSDAVPFGRALIRNAADRLIWGTDWPHVLYRRPGDPGHPPPDDGELMNLLFSMSDNDDEIVRRILAENPLRLYAG